MTDTTATPRRPGLAALALLALGVVYGDIGTSPLYAVREAFGPAHGLAVNATNVLGVLSLIIWTIVLVVVVKYLSVVMRADNRGEGGILALLALAVPPSATHARHRALLIAAGLFGASLLYGDGVITPAISVLSAVEGLEVATPAFHSLVVPITIVILIALFSVQHRGTGRVGALFGPIMLVWFVTIAVTGFFGVVQEPRVLGALNPLAAVRFLRATGMSGFLSLGAVILAITGVEALYADMGHFGRVPIKAGWYAVVLPSLLLNYLGQGAILLSRPDTVHNPFYGLVPRWGMYPMVALAAVATVIASQALISGSFSLTRQAVQLGYLPRVTIVHTSATLEGQIYVPGVNWLLAIVCVLLVITFGASTRLAAAYGMAVLGTMAITTVLLVAVARERWGWSLLKTASLAGVFLLVELAFLAANLIKFAHGGWLPLLLGAAVFTLMTTWKRGRALLAVQFRESTLETKTFLDDVKAHSPVRVAGTAVFMTGNPHGVPPILLHHIKHNKVLHQRVVLMTVLSVDAPTVPPRERVEVTDLGQGFFRVRARYGFMETPALSPILAACRKEGLRFEMAETSFFLGRETLLARGSRGMARWRKVLFAVMSRNARSATAFFAIPPNRVMKLGMQIQL